MPHGVQWCLEGEGTGGGSGGAGAGSGGTGGGSGNDNGRQNPADVVARYNGDAVRLASDLSQSEARNYDLREKNRDLKAENEALKKQVPGEGAVVLTKEQAALWDGFQKLNLKPEEITTQLAAGAAAITENTTFKRLSTLDEAAKALSFKPGVLKLLAKDLNVEMREVEVTDAEGKIEKQKRPFIVAKDGDKETLTGLQEYFKAQGDDVLATLQDDGQNYSASNNGHANGNNGNLNGGTPYPAQGGGSGGGKQSYQPRNRYAHNLPKSE
jgi:hypothetical protein